MASRTEDSSSPPATVTNAYQNWQAVLDAHPELEDGFFFAQDFGPQQLRDAVKTLLFFGPNQTPFLVEQFRRETNSVRLYRLTKLLNKVSGINLYSGREQAVFSDLPKYRDEFIKQWDTGEIKRPERLLIDARRLARDAGDSRKVEAKNTFALRRYGIYGIPFLVREIRRTNSSELFAAFLMITDHREIYAQYLDKPQEMFTTVESKLSFIKRWHQDQRGKLHQLGGLNDNIAEAGQ
jgi:hypothetical protein